MVIADCTGFIEPLNLQCLFVNIFAGSMDLFILISFLVIAGLCAFFRMFNSTSAMMFVLFAIIISPFAQGFLFLAILLIGLFATYLISKVVKN